MAGDLVEFEPPFSFIISENDLILDGSMGLSTEYDRQLAIQNHVADMLVKDRTDSLP